MTARPVFDYAAFRARWREICRAEGLNPRTGYPQETEAVYRLDHTGRRVLCRVPVVEPSEPGSVADPTSPTWWQLPMLFDQPGPAHSVVEAAALASIAQQARAAVGKPEPVAVSTDLPAEIAEKLAALADEGARRLHQLALPLREIHARRGETVAEVLGQRMLVPIKVA